MSGPNLSLLKECKNPIIFIGIGVQYFDHIFALDVGDYFFIRNIHDYKVLRERYGNDRCRYIPDLAHFIDPVHFPKTSKTGPIKKIGMSIPYTWMCENNSRSRIVLFKIKTLVQRLMEKEYEVVYIPFDTSTNNKNSDLILAKTLQKECDTSYVIATSLETMVQLYNSCDLIIGARFHSIILAILTATPFISLVGSTKMKNLKLETLESLNFLFQDAIESDNKPVNFPDILPLINIVESEYINIVKNIEILRDNYNARASASKETILNVVKLPNEQLLRKSPPRYLGITERQALISKTVRQVLQLLGTNRIQDINKVVQNGGDIRPFIPKGNLKMIKKRVTEEILWCITDDPYAPYYYGLFESVFTGVLKDKIEYIIDDYYKNYFYETACTLVNKNFQQIHRSGWQYVVNGLSNIDIPKHLIIDTYIDKTFHWNSDFYKSKNTIPYTSDWIGIIHHTFSEYSNAYNCVELFKKDLFIASLTHCRALIVMSEYLARQIEQALSDSGFSVKVYTLYHPTEDPPVKFSMDLYNRNNCKQLVNVGNWLRNMFAIYEVMLPEDTWIDRKSVLKNKNSDNYFPPKDLDYLLGGPITNTENTHLDICKISTENMHLKGLYEHICRLENSVHVIEHLSNDDYDALFTSNIVFLNYIDASATNTLIECVVRNTPVFVNKIPAVVEILGQDYPLYYTSMYSITKLLERENEYKVKLAHEYLVSLPKDRFKNETFLSTFSTILKDCM